MIDNSSASHIGLDQVAGIDPRPYQSIYGLVSSNKDLAKITRQPGVSKRVMKKIRCERRNVLFHYLKDLRRDAIAAWRSEMMARGEGVYTWTSIKRRCNLEIIITRIAVRSVLHIAGWLKSDLQTIQLLLGLVKHQLAALNATFPGSASLRAGIQHPHSKCLVA